MRPDLLPPSPPPAPAHRGLVRSFVALGLVGLGVAFWVASGGAAFQPETVAEAEAQAAADVEVTRAESATEALVAPEPTLDTRPAEGAPPEGVAPEVVATVPAPEPEPAGLSETPLGVDEALAALAPELAAEAGPETATDAAPDLELAAAPGADLRPVTGDRVNVREGPGTGFAVVGQLVQGEEAEVTELRDGWARVRAGATEGWMSERFLGAPGG